MLRQYLCCDEKFFPAHQLAASLIDLAISHGVDRHKLLRSTGIFYEDIKSGTATLTAQQLLKLVNQAQQLMPGYDCAFQLGRRIFPSNYGAISNAVQHSRNLGEALKLLSLFHLKICPFIYGHIYQDNNKCHLILNDALGCGEQFKFLIEAYSTALVSASKLIFGKRIPFHFNFPYPCPSYIQEYEENLGQRICFSQPILSISFDKKWLKEPFPYHSNSLKTHAIHQLKLGPQQGFLEAVCFCLRHKYSHTLQETAKLFALSPATFKRKLKQHGCSFQELQDQLRKQQAVYWLQLQGLNNEESAMKMKFNDIPNFRRAVKRWTGLTPSQLRLK
ncbi:AraC family transcriptional regulator [Thalassotalea profundi]|uniref:AraC family transcriptional regulator n=1 Tax=Thalassotalea profundi TaxID=2036687 RepID=A0ABQ3IVC3_9GAMM|nr:AraC family transcriptional regulator [Thalassotalea profundi]GHE95813.1 AraC family transcriptional regulator [Thalassotalea profundi]